MNTTPQPVGLSAEIRKIVRLALPVVGSQLSFMALNVADVVMSGRLSAVDLAAVAVGTGFVLPAYIICMGILMSVNPIVAHLYGAGRLDEVGQKLHNSLWTALLLAVPAVLLMFHAGPFLRLLGIEGEVVPLAEGYLRAFGMGLPFAFMFMCFRFFADGLGFVKPTAVVLALTVPLNVAGNYVLMYGKLGMPALGAVGTGYASAINMMFMAVCLGTWVMVKLGVPYKLRRFHPPHWADFKEIMGIGIPNGVSLGMELTMFAAVALFVATMGETQVGAHQIALNIASVTFMFPLGISLALGIRVGQAAGRRDMDGVRLTGRGGLVLTCAIQVTMAAVMALFAPTLVGWYTTDPAVAGPAVQLVYFAAVFQLSDGLQVVCLGALRGLKDTRLPMVSNFAAYWVVGFPLGYYLGMVRAMGPSGFWLGMMAGLTLAAVLHAARFRHLLKVRDGGDTRYVPA